MLRTRRDGDALEARFPRSGAVYRLRFGVDGTWVDSSASDGGVQRFTRTPRDLYGPANR